MKKSIKNLIKRGVVLMLTATMAAGSYPGMVSGSASSDNGDGTFTNPVIFADVPDPDIIRVDDAFYMVSTTMHMSPGVPVMRSYDLVNWEIINYVYDQLEENDACALKKNKNDYANGSWAASIRYDKYEKRFYVEFSCQSTNKSYFYSTGDIENGPWHCTKTVKCYDGSMLFEDTGTECKKYMFYEDTTSHSDHNMLCMREMNVDRDTWDVSLGEQVVLIEQPNVEDPPKGLKAEGVHVYKINGYYYAFMIQGQGWQRQEICWRSESLTPGSFEVKKIFTGNMVDENGKDVMASTGIAQGGIVDTADGRWYSMLFQDYGSVGRVPVLMPVEWDDDGWPVLGNGGLSADYIMDKPVEGKAEKSVVLSDEFNNKKVRKIYSDTQTGTGITAGIPVSELEEKAAAGLIDENEYGYNGSNLSLVWQWNHNPNNNLWSLTDREGYLRLKSGIISTNIQNARNTLTQRTYGPQSAASVALEADNIKDGDYAGLSAFQNQYGFVGIKMEGGKKYIVMHRAQEKGDAKGTEIESIPFEGGRVYFKVFCDFSEDASKSSSPKCADKASFYYSLDNENWNQIGDELQMSYDWPHFVGYRFGLFYYSTENVGGYVDFDYFHIADGLNSPYIPEPVDEPGKSDEKPVDEPKNTTGTDKPAESGSVISPAPSAGITETPQPVVTPDAGKVKVDAAGYIIKGNRLCMKKGTKTILRVSSTNAADITYESSDKKIADVSGKGILKIKGTGEATIRIKASGQEKAVIKIKAYAKHKVNKKLKLSRKVLNLKKGATAVVGIRKITAGTTNVIKYRSADKKVAKVDAYGMIRANKKGKTIIRVTCGKKKASVRVKVS